MADKKTRYALTASVGDLPKGGFIDLTDAQAASALYAPRIAALQESGDASTAPDAAAIRAEILAELESNIPPFLADAKAQGEKLVEDGKAQATKLVDDAKAEAKQIVETAQAEAMKLATAPKK